MHLPDKQRGEKILAPFVIAASSFTQRERLTPGRPKRKLADDESDLRTLHEFLNRLENSQP